MADVAELLSALKTSAQTISGLIVHDYQPDSIVTPALILSLPAGDRIAQHDATLDRASWWNFTALLLVSRVSDREAQKALYAYLSTSGSKSIRNALETSRTLGGKAHVLLVDDPENWGEFTVADVSYWGAEWNVRVLA